MCLSVCCSWLLEKHRKGLIACFGYERRVMFILWLVSFCVLQLVMWWAHKGVKSMFLVMKKGFILCSFCVLHHSVCCSWLCDEHIKGLKACSGYEERVRFILCFASFCVLQLVMWQAQGKVISLLSLLKKGGHVRVSARLLRLLVHRTGSKKKILVTTLSQLLVNIT